MRRSCVIIYIFFFSFLLWQLLNSFLSRRAIVSCVLVFLLVRYGRDPSGGYVWLRNCYCLFLLGGVFSIVGQLPVNICGKWCDRVDLSFIGNYIELGINNHMSAELLLLEGGCRIRSLLRCNYCVFVWVHCVAWRKYSVSHWCTCSMLVDKFSY